MKKLATIFSIVSLFWNARTSAQEFIPLWPEGKKPNSTGLVVKDSLFNERIWRVGTPGIYVFPVARSENKGTTVLICPGGGYERLSHLYNGFNFARWFNTLGINAYVLIYRLPHQQDLRQRQRAPLQDAQRALRLIRANAQKWGVNPEKIGVMGVSAGGHVASTLGTHLEDVSALKDSLDKVSYRPDFMILLSPVITMGPYAHPGSKQRFLGADTTKAAIERYSNERRVSPATPPAFLVHALNDSTVSVRNSLMFYEALLNNKVNASIHIFPQGGHGIKLVDNPGSTDLWMDLLELWMNENHFVPPSKK